MKIEFCCEDAYRHGTFGVEKDLVAYRISYYPETRFARIGFCPYCGSKIEITVRKEEG